ncbi:MAG: hypothetical protein ACMVO5_02665 [Polymorphobacter sp.]|uniref:hypothetical protein n=1 Tax=Polymorphobacter sp. TaxID=1909290 RepID=UPI003A8C0E3C
MPRVQLLLIAAATLAAAAAAQTLSLPEAPGKQQVEAHCTRCHGVEVITAQPRSPDEWMEVVSIMVGNGVKLTDQEYDEVVTYLSNNLAPPETSGN